MMVCVWKRVLHAEAEWTSTVEVPNRSHSHNCKCLVLPNLAFLLAPIPVLDLGHHHLPRSEEIWGVASHLDSRIRLQAKVRTEGSTLTQIQRHRKAQMEDFHLLHQSLRKLLRLGSHSANPRRIATLHPPPDLLSANQDLKQQTQHLLGSPSRHRNQSNIRRVLRSDRHYLNLPARLLRLGSVLDKRSLSNRRPLLRSRLALPQVAGHLDLHLPVLHLAHSSWHLRRLRHSHLQDPPVHQRNNLRQIRSGLVRGVGNPRRLPYSKASRLTLGEARRRRRQDHS